MAPLTPSPLTFGYLLRRVPGQTDENGLPKYDVDRNTPLPYTNERHILLFGLNGAGKSTRVLVENLLTLRNRSLVVFDVKGELAAQTARARRQFGDVVIINPCGVLDIPSDGYNPLAMLDPAAPSFYEDAAALGDAMIEIEGNDPHWPESAQGLLVALIMWEVMLARRDYRAPSLANVRRMLTQADEFDAKDELVKGLAITARHMVEHGGEQIASLAGRFTRPDSREIASIKSTADTQTRWLLSASMARDLEKNGVDFKRLRDRPVTVYIILPAGEITHFRRWTRMVITAALRQQMRPGPVKTLFILDEFRASVGNLKVISDVWSLVRGYGIQLMPVVQSALQLKALFKEEWENFAAQAGAIVTIGPPGDLETAEWMSKRSGTTTITETRSSFGQSMGPSGMSDSDSTSTGPAERRFLLPQELMSMKPGTGRIWTPGAGNTSIPFFAPVYWRRAELRGHYDANPYYEGSPASLPSDSPSPSMPWAADAQNVPLLTGASVAADIKQELRWAFSQHRQQRLPGDDIPRWQIWTALITVAVVLAGLWLFDASRSQHTAPPPPFAGKPHPEWYPGVRVIRP